MIVGMIDVDNWGNLKGCFPNLPIMKLSTYHKKKGDTVKWYDGEYCDLVYMSKVFSFSEEPFTEINAGQVIKGGSGYAISLKDGHEVFDKETHTNLPYEIEHSFPDYSLYGITDTAYGFMSRGCPRQCDFCHVKDKEGIRSYKVADLSEFWNGQKHIQLFDPNTLACKEWRDILQQLIDSGASVDFNQGVDIRLLTDEKIELLKQIKLENIHFAYDRYEDKAFIEPKFRKVKELTGWGRALVTVYVLTNFNTTIEQDLDRIMFLRSLDFRPYVMRYDKEHIKRGSEINKLARYCNSKYGFIWKYTYDEYKKITYKEVSDVRN